MIDKFEVPKGWTKGSRLIVFKQRMSGDYKWFVEQEYTAKVSMSAQIAEQHIAYKWFDNFHQLVQFIEWWQEDITQE